MDQTPWGQAFRTGAGQPVSGHPVPGHPVPGYPVSPEPNTTGEQPPVSPQTAAFFTGYPFEEPEQAPELRQERSDNLYSRSEPFWERIPDPEQAGKPYPLDANYWNHPEVLSDDQMLEVDLRKQQRPTMHLGAGVVKKLLIVLGVLLAVGILLYSVIFQVREIRVVGNTGIPAAEIIRLSGLKTGMNTMSIDEKNVTRRIENNRYLRCTLVDVKWNSVALHVRERVPAVYINHNGMTVVLDNRGWVLEESLDTGAPQGDLIFVTGLNVRRCNLGQAITLHGSSQMTAYTTILVELKAMQGLDIIKELDLARMDRIYLATRDGFYIHLGDDERIHEKLRAMMITRDKVIELGYDGGTIDVTDPEKPTFTPANLM